MLDSVAHSHLQTKSMAIDPAVQVEVKLPANRRNSIQNSTNKPGTVSIISLQVVLGLTRAQGSRLGSITPGPGGISSAASTPGLGAQGANSKVPTCPTPSGIFDCTVNCPRLQVGLRPAERVRQGMVSAPPHETVSIRL